MIPINEIRCGSWFIEKSTGKYFDVDIHSIEGAVMCDWFDPIPLSTEILRDNLSFIYKASNYQYNEPSWVYKGEDILSFGIDEENGMYYFNKLSNMPDVQIKYVHQLQDLFRVLTGEELEVVW